MKDKYVLANQTIAALVKIPTVQVDRKNFLKDQFKGDPNLKRILAEGPQAVYSADELRDMANDIIKDNVGKAATTSILAGLPSNPLIMLGTGAADVAQFFGLSLRMAQQLAYLFGSDELFSAKSKLTDAEEERLLALLGAMFGVSGAAAVLFVGSKRIAEPIGTKLAGKAAMKAVGHPVIKKIGHAVGSRIFHQSLGQTLTKSVPVIGAVSSGALTYVTFKPMGARLADLLAENLKEQEKLAADQDQLINEK
ncbi:hypothetical protein JOC36_000086 [Weissella uvarum]|uniref:hypothetical protein n=1 Tax=Weissella uvarum TaxID=1479233 RepID=UPI00195F8E08|nr:hypothetical protein [Weissella uvarum]MBM7616553.1 hypothetical protein [Weissella uvarum]MCM0594987.1 hypothetical protein [Weissella uvarum]